MLFLFSFAARSHFVLIIYNNNITAQDILHTSTRSYTLSGSIGMVVARVLKVTGSIPGRGCTDLNCARSAQEVLLIRVGGNGQSIGSTLNNYLIIDNY